MEHPVPDVVAQRPGAWIVGVAQALNEQDMAIKVQGIATPLMACAIGVGGAVIVTQHIFSKDALVIEFAVPESPFSNVFFRVSLAIQPAMTGILQVSIRISRRGEAVHV